MYARFAVVVFSVLTCVNAFTQELRPRSWPQEPNSFLGIQFGKPLLSSVRECPSVTEYGYTAYREFEANYPCFGKYGNSYIVYNVHTFYEVYPVEVNGKVESISAIFKSRFADDITQALTEKFGSARLNKTITVQNRMGASFEDHTLKWIGASVEIDFNSIESKVDEGSIAAYTSTYVESKTQDQKQQKDAVKGVL